MIFLTAQPDRIKFYWQLRVQLANFSDMGISMSDVHILVGCDLGQPSKEMKSLRDTGAKVFFYPYAKDYRYVSSVRPHVLKQHFARFPHLSQEYLFYLDSDVIFRRLPDFSQLPLNGNWYVSDASNYIGSHYVIHAGGPEIFMDMCAVVGIDPMYVKAKEAQAGGCQYIMTGTDEKFWEKVERDCIELFISHPKHDGKDFKGPNMERYTALGERPIQIWCADMWSILWNAWLRGIDTIVTPELAFTWAHLSVQDYYERPILHMAGVCSTTKDNEFGPHFDKMKYDRTLPFNDDFSWVNKKSASSKYTEYFNRFKDANTSNN